MEVRRAASLALGMVVAPGRTLDRIAGAPVLGAAVLVVVSTALLWSALCVVLWSGGHSPSRPLVPIAPQSYYLAQALWLVPAVVVGWTIVGGTCHGLARRLGGSGTLRSTFACAGFAYAVPLACLLVVPDLVAYLLFGFGALGKVVRVSGLLLVGAEWALCARAVMAAHGLAPGRAVPIALLGLVAQAVVIGPILR